MSELVELKQICPPPSGRDAQGVPDWASVEQNLGTELPEDYKRLVETYGPGAFNGFIHLFQPISLLKSIDIEEMSRTVQSSLEVIRSRGGRMPHLPKALQLAGVTDNGEYIFWVKDPEVSSSAWEIAVNEARGDEWYAFKGNLTAFLLEVVSSRLAVPLFPRSLLGKSPSFVPYGA